LQVMETEWPKEIFEGLTDLVLYPDYNNSFLDLDAGRVDAVVVGGVYGNYIVNLRGEENYNVYLDSSAVEPMAVGLRKSNTELAKAINQAFEDMQKDGTYEEIYTKWFGNSGTSRNNESIFQNMLPSLNEGLKVTLGLFLIVLVASIPLGLFVAIPRAFGSFGIKGIIEIYVFIMRSTPLLLQLMVVFFGLPYLGVNFTRFPAAIFAFILNYTAYFVEIFRGGFAAISPGQYESLKVLGIGKVRGFFRIIVPQVLAQVLPALGNEVVALVKDTSLVYVIGLGVNVRVDSISANSFDSLTAYLIVGVLYMIIVGSVTILLRQIEKKITYCGECEMSLIVENLSKNFNHQSVIRNYNLTIDENEVVALVGRSGTGKTTFLRLINNLEVADQGTIQINEDFLLIDGAYVDKEGQRNYQKRMGMVFQNYELFPNLNVLANLVEAPLAQKLAS